MFKNISAVREIVTYGEEQVLRSIETYNLQEGNVGLSVAVAQQIPGMVLHKTETISDWTVDRLRVPQERYAGLDSAVLQLLDNRRPAPNPGNTVPLRPYMVSRVGKMSDMTFQGRQI